MCRVTRLFRPTDRLARTLLAPALVFIATSVDRNYQTDLWHHLARGRVLVEEGALLDTDAFTFTVPGQPFRDVNWGWQAAFYCLYRAGGFPLVQTVNSALLALMMGLLVSLARQRSGSPLAACVCCVTAFFGLWPLLIIRPQTFSLLLFVVLLCVLDAAARRPRWLIVAPILMGLWVNVHGGFPIGLVLIGAYTFAVALDALFQEVPANSRRAAQCRRASLPWLVCLAFCVGATLANPYGWHVYQYVGQTSARAAARHLDEWLPPGLDTLTGKVFALSLVATFFLSALPGRRSGLRESMVACCFLPLACGSVRMVAWWLLVCTPVLATRLAAVWPRLRAADIDDDRPSVSAAFVNLLLMTATVMSFPSLQRWNPLFLLPGRAHRTEADLQAAVDHVAERGGHRVFTRFSWGEYVGWALAGRGTVFMDGRIEIYPDEVWARYAAVTRGRADWQQILDDYGVDCLLLDASGYDGQLLPFVEASENWREQFRQGDSVLFVREGERKPSSPQTERANSPPGPRAALTE
jgi:hypothetical protein